MRAKQITSKQTKSETPAQKSPFLYLKKEGESKASGLIRELVSIPSTFPHEEKIARYCADYLQKNSFDVELQQWAKGRYNVIAKKGPAPSILLSAHLDTVPALNYSYNPYEIRSSNGIWQALGVYDMKAGLALLLHSASLLKPSSKTGVKLILTSDEENISEGTWAAGRSGHYSDSLIAIVPEIIDTVYSTRHLEPSHNPMPLLFGRRGRGVYQIDIKTPPAHGAEPKGLSSIRLATDIVSILDKIKRPKHPKLGVSSWFVREIKGASKALEFPTSASVFVDAHFVPPFTQESFQDYLKTEVGRRFTLPSGAFLSWSIPARRTPYLNPYETDLNGHSVAQFLSILNSHGGKSRISYGYTVADENIIAQYGIPCVTWAPHGGRPHQSGEWVSQIDFLRLEDLYPRVLQGFIDSYLP